MSRRKLFPMLLVAVLTLCALVLPGTLSAQGNREEAFARVQEVQERHTEKLLAKGGVVGTAIGLDEDEQPVVLVLLEKEGVPDIPAELEGIPVRRVVTGTIYALPKGGKPAAPGAKTPPEAPTGLNATARSSNQIDLTWTDNATNEKGFKIECKTDTTSYVQIATTGANTTSYSHTGVSAPTTYTYRVRAYNKYGDSAYSNEATATPLAPPASAPTIPTGLTATAAGSTQINLDWADNPATDQVTSYNVYRSQTSGGPYTNAGSASASSYSDTGLTASTTYYYVVTAVNAFGSSGYSDQASATTAAVSVPTDPRARFPRPVPIGVSTGHPSITAGTISCRVTNGSAVYVLSNNHVYAASNAATPGVDPVLQPGDYDGGSSPADDIGTLAAFKPIIWYPNGTNTIDAALAATDEGKVGNATPAAGYGTPSSTPVAARMRQAVQKYGRTTGLTHGVVKGLNANILVDYGSDGTAYFTGQIMISPGTFSAGGDSGSLIVTDDANCNPVGLLFAGSASATYANPISNVLSYFGVSVDGR
jgi:hypothetical protein